MSESMLISIWLVGLPIMAAIAAIVMLRDNDWPPDNAELGFCMILAGILWPFFIVAGIGWYALIYLGKLGKALASMYYGTG